ncbi:motile sperm domain-containing protein 2 isoform X1 [Hydra vulgaris]|uniref:motile sperm domain-containing protein 2 isoform X1 n=1 Tax=Hydra vulgaris TaxID=6087 RepID=UPI001F5F6A60|nr:motile sperm domain-containing protein 2-like [Hydra vulgaris]
MEHQNEDRPLIEELRKRFLSRGPELEEFDKRDIERVHQDDIYVEFFFNHKHGDMEKALEMMVDCLKWRSQFGINDIMERNIDRRLFELGFLYPRNKDKHGNPLLFFHMKKYKKELFDMKEVKKLFAFALEKLSLQYPGKQITMVFDMQDSGISNMDMDLIKFVITCFQLYFPNILEYLIVYETPWILTAAWKIVKGWMSSDGISKIKMVGKNDITSYIAPEKLLSCMGGLDDFVYKYPPQMFSAPPTARFQNVSSTNEVFNSISISLDNTNKKNILDKAEKNADSNFDESSFGESNRVEQNGSNIDLTCKKSVYRRNVRNYAKSKLESAGPFITLSPANELVFCENKSGDIMQTITITNTVSSLVAFKIKTTTPENFRVRPSSGPISPSATVEVQIYLQPEFDIKNITKDKFLILSAVIPDNINDINSLWKTIPRSSIMEQRLRCRLQFILPSESDHDSSPSHKSDKSSDPKDYIYKQLKDCNNKIDRLQKRVIRLEHDVLITYRFIILLVVVVIVFFIIGAVFFIKSIFFTK